MFEEHDNRNHHERHLHNWLHRIDMIPKGFLRYHVLEALNEKPMSGSELIEQIQKNSSGRWKPSPGSIYPLLAFLEDSAYVKELPKENGVKRYQLTESGQSFLEHDQQKVREHIGKLREHMNHMNFFQKTSEDLHTGVSNQKGEIMQAILRLHHVTVQIVHALQENYSQEVEKEGLTILKDATTKLEDLKKKMQDSEGRDNDPTF